MSAGPGLQLGSHLWGEDAGNGQWRVWSLQTLQTYVVDPGAGTCACPDHKIKKKECKHLAALKAALKAGATPSQAQSETEVKQMEQIMEKIKDGKSNAEPAEVSIVPVDSRVPFPLAELATLRKAVDKFIEIRNGLLTADDIVRIGKIAEPRRSGWDRTALAYGVSIEVPTLEPVQVDGKVAFRAKAVAWTPGRTRCTEGHAYCTVEEVNERSGKPDARAYHFAAATAESRAVKRAMVGLMGGGDLSAADIEAIEKRK